MILQPLSWVPGGFITKQSPQTLIYGIQGKEWKENPLKLSTLNDKVVEC